MRTNFLLKRLLFLTAILLLMSRVGFTQCPWPGSNNRGTYNAQCGTTVSMGTIGPGDYVLLPIVAGARYTLENCSGTGSANWNPAGHLFNNATGALLASFSGSTSCGGAICPSGTGGRFDGNFPASGWEVNFTGVARLVIPGEGGCSGTSYNWNACYGSAALNYRQVNNINAVTPTATQTSFCTGGSTTLSAAPTAGTGASFAIAWYRVGTGTSIGSGPSISTGTLTTGSYQYYYTATLGACSSTSGNVTITVNASPTANTSVTESSGTTANDGIICSGASASITATGGTSYLWNTTSTANPLVVSPTATTTYTVTVTNANGCTASATKTINVTNSPNPSAVATSPVCESGTINFSSSPSGMTSYSWGGPVSYSASGQTATRTNVTTSMGGVYTVTVTDVNNCSANANTNSVAINPKPAASVSYQSCSGVDGLTTIKITGSGGSSPYTYRLSPASFGSSNTFSVNNGSSGNLFEVRDAANCISNTISIATSTQTPTTIPNTTTSCIPCQSSGENRWLYLTNGTNVVMLVHDQGNNLGTLNATVYKHPSPVIVNDPGVGNMAALGRNWVVTSSTQPSTNITYRFPFTNSEYTSLQYSSDTTPTYADAVLAPNYIDATRVVFPGSEDNVYNTTGATTVQLLIQQSNGTLFGGMYAEYSAPGTSEYFLGGSEHNAPLPVTLVNFTVQANELGALLQWVTASEIDNDKFEIERAVTIEGNFVTVGEVDGNGTTTTMTSYGFQDNLENSGVYYYRLKQIDYDGDYEYSPIKAVTYGDVVHSISVYPNPTTGNFRIELWAEASAELRITDVLGKQVYTQKLEQFNQVQLPRDMLNGVYVLTIQTQNEIFTHKITIHR